MDKILCPHCSREQKQKPLKSWEYGKMIEDRTNEKTVMGEKVNCSRYECICKKKFNFYKSKNKSWTIPKSLIK